MMASLAPRNNSSRWPPSPGRPHLEPHLNSTHIMHRTLPIILGLAAFTAVKQGPHHLRPAEPVPPAPGAPAPPVDPATPSPPSAPRHKRSELKQAAIPSVMGQAAAPASDGLNAKAGAAVSLAAKNLRTLEADRWLPRSARTGRTL